MKRMLSRATVTLIAVTAIALLSPMTVAQPVWLEPTNKSSGSLEILLPQFKTDPGEDLNVVTVILTGRVAVSDNAALVMDVPYSSASYSYNSVSYGHHSESQSSLGNIYVGAKLGGGRDRDFFTEIGIRLPTSSKENLGAQEVGLFSDIDRFPSFGSNVSFSVGAAQNYYHESPSKMVVRIRAGATFVRYKEGYESGDIYVNYTGQVGARLDRVLIMGGISGLLKVTHMEGADIGQRTMHQLGFTVTYAAGQVHPGIVMRLPLDRDLKDIMSSTIGFNVSFLVK